MMALLLLLLSPAQANTLVCTTAPGAPLSVRYETSSYSGGAAPGPEVVQHAERWVVDGATVWQTRQTYGGEDLLSGDFDWAWNPKTTRVTKSTGSKFHSVVVYTTTVKLWTSKGPVAEAVALTCTRESFSGMP